VALKYVDHQEEQYDNSKNNPYGGRCHIIRIDSRNGNCLISSFHLLKNNSEVAGFPLCGIKDSPPYLHGGRLPILENTVEFFNLILELKLNDQEKKGPCGLYADTLIIF